MAIASAFIAYVGSTAYDLRKVAQYSIDPENSLYVRVRFTDSDETVITLAKSSFEEAYAAALTAEGG